MVKVFEETSYLVGQKYGYPTTYISQVRSSQSSSESHFPWPIFILLMCGAVGFYIIFTFEEQGRN
ncbi:MAG TPA: hypothetical protein VK118_01915 [Tetragenococcus sp.]|nr:hypothetical protein [Tetragenococcus sp.]